MQISKFRQLSSMEGAYKRVVVPYRNLVGTICTHRCPKAYYLVVTLDGQPFVSMRFRALLSPRGGPRAPQLALVARGGVKTKRVRALYDF